MKVLHIIASPRGERSVSRKLGDFAADSFEGIVTTVDVHAEKIPCLSEAVIAYNYGYGDYASLSLEDKKIADAQRKYVDQIKSADVVVISAPMWNFSVPAALKAWIDLIIKVNETFSLDAQGYHGLVKNVQKAVVVTSAGGTYEGTAFAPYDHLNGYLQGILGFIGITESKVFRVESVNVTPNLVAEKVSETEKRIGEYARG
jgi:FMN-dependent NADH-azoreductase